MYDKSEYDRAYNRFHSKSIAEYRKRHNQEYSRYYINKYRNDEVFRERHKTLVRAYYSRNRQKVIDHNNKLQYENYHNYPEYRRKQLDRNKKWRETHPELIKQYNYNNRLRKKIFNTLNGVKIHGQKEKKVR